MNGRKIVVCKEMDPEKLPWRKCKVDVVVESTGHFIDKQGASKHLKAGAKKVLITAVGKDPDITLVKGVNEKEYDRRKHFIISKGSCTTTCLAPVVKVLNDEFGIEKGFMTTVHAVTNEQRLLDLPHKDLRKARSVLASIIPTTTGAAKAVALTIPELEGKLDGMAMRVPIADGSIVDLVALLKKETTVEEVNELFKKVSQKKLKGIIEYTEEPIVGVDVIGNKHSAIFDALSTKVNGNLVKVVAWYDNEAGYAYRVIDMIKIIK